VFFSTYLLAAIAIAAEPIQMNVRMTNRMMDFLRAGLRMLAIRRMGVRIAWREV
jgi:hypothetical protein